MIEEFASYAEILKYAKLWPYKEFDGNGKQKAAFE